MLMLKGGRPLLFYRLVVGMVEPISSQSQYLVGALYLANPKI